MLRLGKILLLIAALWSAYWGIAGWGIARGISAWFEEQRRQGWQAEVSDLVTAGYPLQHVTRLTHPVLADPASGAAWRADWLEIHSPALWPGSQRLVFPDTPQRLSYFDQTLLIRADGLRADLDLAPGVSLRLDHLALHSQAWQLRGAEGDLLSGLSLQGEMRRGDGNGRYDLRLTASGLTPSTALRRLLSAGPSLPDSFETLSLRMNVLFDSDWDRRALELRRPQPRQITLHQAEAHWGLMRLRATGAVDLDDQGLATGSLSIKAENWRDMLQMLGGPDRCRRRC